jgi:Ni,Fe-hydrogenase III small subunit
VRSRSALIAGGEDTPGAEPLRRALGERAHSLRRSVHVRHIDCGSDGAEEWEIQALWNPYYDIQRLGFFLTAAPRHADILLVTGAVTSPMRLPLARTWEVMPEPKALVAVGTDACSGGLSAGGTLTAGGVDEVLAVDVYVPGSPPAPIAIMHGLLLATGVLTAEAVLA